MEACQKGNASMWASGSDPGFVTETPPDGIAVGAATGRSHRDPLSVLADLAGFDIEESTAEGGVAAAKEDLTIVAGQIKAGTAAAQRIIVPMPFPVPLDDLASYVPAFNANGPVNAIPYVCGAPAGILTTQDLPHIPPRGPRRQSI
jgi:hypothetical protein